jgi:glycosyltransferase involved in cell wall biosynthesis
MIVTPVKRQSDTAEVVSRSGPGGTTTQPLAGVCVAAIIDTSVVSGPSRQLVHLALGLRARGVRMHVILFGGPRRVPSALRPVLESADIEHTVVLEKRRSDLSVVPRLRRTLDSIGVHLVQTHGYRPAVLAYLVKRSGLRTPWVAFSHGVTTEDWKVRLYHRLDRWVSRRADRIVVMSRRHAEDWSDVDAKVDVIYNAVIDAVDAGELPPATMARVRSLPRPRVGVIGRLSSEKGVDVFLEALSLLRDRGINVSGVIAGDGPERAALEADTRARGLTASVALLGAVQPIAPLYRELDAIVIPSRSEGLPNVLLEACRLDTPFLATRVGGIPEIVSPNRAGILVEPGRAADLAEGVATLLARLNDVESRDGRRRIAEQVSLQRRVEAHVQLYAGLLCRE